MTSNLDEMLRLFGDPETGLFTPKKVADHFALKVPALSAALGFERGMMRSKPRDPDVQQRLHDIARVFLAALELNPDKEYVAFHLRVDPIRVLGYRSIFDAVRDGDADLAMRYMCMVRPQ